MAKVLTQEEIDAHFDTPEKRDEAMKLLIEMKYLVRQVYGFYPVQMERSLYKRVLDVSHGFTVNDDGKVQEGYDD